MILHDPARGGVGEVQRNNSGNIHLAHTPPYALEFGLTCDNFGDTCAKGQNEGSSKNIPTSEMINLEWIWILRPKHFGDIDRPDIQKHLIDTWIKTHWVYITLDCPKNGTSLRRTKQTAYKSIPVVPHKAVAEVSKIGNV